LETTVGSSGIRVVDWYGLMQRYRLDQVTPFALLMPVIGVLAGAVFLGQRLSLVALLGGMIVLAGLAFAIVEPAGSEPPRR
jgi:O-acetylserine/cysteine efflux transporter